MTAWSKEVFAKNLLYYMQKHDVNQKELADAVNVAPSTLNEWLKAKKYPRIDKIEILSDYFGILKSDLIEEKTAERIKMQKNNDAITDIIARLRTDAEFLSIVGKMNNLDSKKLASIEQLLDTFL